MIRASDFLPSKPEPTIEPEAKYFGPCTVSKSTIVSRKMANAMQAECDRRGIKTAQFLREAIRRELEASREG